MKLQLILLFKSGRRIEYHTLVERSYISLFTTSSPEATKAHIIRTAKSTAFHALGFAAHNGAQK